MLKFVYSGIIRTALPNMDREARQEYDVVIQAKDMGGHMGGLSGTTEVKITLIDVNDNPPKFPQSEYRHLPSIYYIYLWCNISFWGVKGTHLLPDKPHYSLCVLQNGSFLSFSATHICTCGLCQSIYVCAVLYVCVYNRDNMLLASNIEAREATVGGTKDNLRNQLLKVLYWPPAMSSGVCVCVCVCLSVCWSVCECMCVCLNLSLGHLLNYWFAEQ